MAEPAPNPAPEAARRRRGAAGRVVVVGGSAGALAPLLEIVEGLRTGVDAAVVACLHRHEASSSMLAHLLARRSALPATEPAGGDPVHAGYIFVAPAGRHLEIVDGTFRLTREPKVNGHRPSIDMLFRSAAHAYGPKAVGIMLSGTLADGADGLRAIERAGGAVIIQEPSDAQFPDMPAAAIRRTEAPTVVPRRKLRSATLDALSGSLWLSPDREDPAISCRVDRALWAAVRTLEEQAAVANFRRDMSERRGEGDAAERFRAQSAVTAEQASTLREVLLRLDTSAG